MTIRLVDDIDIEAGEPVEGTDGGIRPPFSLPPKYSVDRKPDEGEFQDSLWLQGIDPDIHYYTTQLQELVPKHKRWQVLVALLLQPDYEESMSWVKPMRAITFADIEIAKSGDS